MKCELCQGGLKIENYKEILPFVNIKAHKEEDWEECKQNMMNNNMKDFLTFYGEYKGIIQKFPEEFTDIENMITSGNRLELVMNIDRLGAVLNSSSLEDTTPIHMTNFIPIMINLDKHTYHKLVAYELEEGAVLAPEQLKQSTREIFNKIQKGEFNLHSYHYYGKIPGTRTEQYIRIPREMMYILEQPWMNNTKKMERVLIEFSETIDVSRDSLLAASSLVDRKISSVTASKRSNRAKSFTVNYQPLARFCTIEDKRALLESTLTKKIKYNALIKGIGKATSRESLSTIRVDKQSKFIIDRYSEETGAPQYKVVTALLIIGMELNS